MSATNISSAAGLVNSIINSQCIPLPLRQQFPSAVKSLSEHKMKRLSILAFINENKTILFTKKAFKHEKEKIWRQVFDRMIIFGMVSKEKDWRYVRDVSFSNWRKRAQKRLRCLSANGYCVNMDECEFLIHDILGKTPDKLSGKVISSDLDQDDDMADWNGSAVEQDMQFGEQNYAMDDDESDEYMIDSNEEDDDDDDETGAQFNEMLFVPKVVLNEPESGGNLINNHHNNNNNNNINHIETDSKSNGIKIDNPQQQQMQQKIVRKHAPNGLLSSHHQDYETSLSSNYRFSSKLREMRLLDLEIENKLLKNRYMKLKVFEMEQNLGLDHCKEVKDLFGSTKLKIRT